METGVIEKTAALASRERGDARQAVTLLARSAYLAEKRGGPVSLDVVDQAAGEIEQDRYVTMIRTSPVQLQLAMGAVIEAARTNRRGCLASNEAYDAYRQLCQQAQFRSLSRRAFGDLLNELDLYSFLRTRICSRGRCGKNRELDLNLPDQLIEAIKHAVFLNIGLGTR